MYIATITVQSNVFPDEPAEEVLRKIANEIYLELNKLVKKHSLERDLRIEAYWRKGCVVEHFLLFAQNAEAWIGIAEAAGGYKLLKEYKSLREGALLITQDLRNFSKTVCCIPVKVVRSVILDKKPSEKGEKLSLSPIEDDNQVKNNSTQSMDSISVVESEKTPKIKEMTKKDHQVITIEGQEYSDSDFNNMSPEEQVVNMRNWFFEYFEDPVERTPYESSEGGYIYIWGGPYIAHDELSVFSGFVDDELIESLANELSRDCPEWTSAERPSDYEDSYFDLILSGSSYYESFYNSVNHVDALLKIEVEADTKNHLLGVLYVSVITAIETYLSDAFINTVLADADYTRSFIESNPEFSKKTFQLSDIYAKFENIENEVKTYLLGLMWHNVEKIKPMYKSTLDVDFPKDLRKIFRAVNIRHDLVHRNGKNVKGEEVTVSEEDLESLLESARDFIEHINSQLDGSDEELEF